MSRSLPVPAFLALFVAACVTKGATGPTPTATPTPAGPPEAWSGTARYSVSRVDSLYPDYPPLVFAFTETVAWQRNPTPTQPPPAGAVSYAVVGGEMTVTVTGGPCLLKGDGRFAVRPPQPGEEPNYLLVKADGGYHGWIQQEVQVTATMSPDCPGPPTVETRPQISLLFTGNLKNGRVQGEMVPETVGGVTLTGSWDFERR